MTYNKSYSKEYTQKNREKINDYHNRWSKENRDKRRITESKWRKNNKETVKRLKHESYLRNRDKTLKKVKIYYLKNKDWLNSDIHGSAKKYREKNREKINKRTKEWGIKNKDRLRKRIREWGLKNRKKLNEYARIRMAKYKKESVNFRLDCNMRSDIWHALKYQKEGRNWEKLVGYTLQQLMNHLEKRFDSKMNWANYPSYWEIDHIKPRSLFSFNSYEDEEFKKCWALENLNPLEKRLNRIKSNKYENPLSSPTIIS